VIGITLPSSVSETIRAKKGWQGCAIDRPCAAGQNFGGTTVSGGEQDFTVPTVRVDGINAGRGQHFFQNG